MTSEDPNYPCFNDPRLLAAARKWGPHPFDWKKPIYRQPKWFELAARRNDRDVREVFGDFDRDAFWSEFGKGQYYDEDCGGFLLRCYRAMLSLPVGDGLTHEAVAIDMLMGEG